MKHIKYTAEHIDFIAECISMMTDEEIAQAFHEHFGIKVTPKVIRHLIAQHNLTKYCVPPNTDRPWELVKENKVQCAICGRWLKSLHGHVEYKHGMSLAEYKERFGINATQPLCSKKLSELHRKKAFSIFKHDKEELRKRVKTMRAHTYKKRKQAIIQRIEKGLQKKAAKSPKPRPLRKKLESEYLDYILVLRAEGFTYKQIANTMSEKVNGKVTEKIIGTIIRNIKNRKKHLESMPELHLGGKTLSREEAYRR